MSRAEPAAAPAADPIPLFDPKAQYTRLKAEIDARVADALARGAYVNGPEIAELEGRLAEIAGAPHCIACANGTDALTLALLADGIGPGDAVFVPAFTYVATAGAVRLAGAVPVFCDVDPESRTLDPADLDRQAERVRRSGRLTPRAVIPVDLYGLPADYPAIAPVARAHGLAVIADAAQSMGARLNAAPVGALAPVTTVSFYPTKPLACAGDGGAIFTDDAERAERLRSMRTHGTDASRTAARLGMNSRLDTLQAAVLLAKLPAMETERARRADLAARYRRALDGAVDPAADRDDAQSAWALYTVASDRREAIRSALAAQNIGNSVYYSRPVHLHPAYRAFGDGPGSLPVSEGLAERVLSLPLTADMTEDQVDRVAAAVRAAAGA